MPALEEQRTTYELVREGELEGTPPPLVGDALRALVPANGHKRLTADEAISYVRQSRREQPRRFSFEFRDLSKLVSDGVEPPKMLLDGLLYEGASHWFSGHPKRGKTILVMHAAIQLIE